MHGMWSSRGDPLTVSRHHAVRTVFGASSAAWRIRKFVAGVLEGVLGMCYNDGYFGSESDDFGDILGKWEKLKDVESKSGYLWCSQ